jgi:hypothetical protein
MAKFTLKCEQYDYNIYTGTKSGLSQSITHEFELDELDMILENFEMFLRGCGYGFSGRVDIVKDDYKVEAELPDNDCSSEFYDGSMEIDFDVFKQIMKNHENQLDRDFKNQTFGEIKGNS